MLALFDSERRVVLYRFPGSQNIGSERDLRNLYVNLFISLMGK